MIRFVPSKRPDVQSELHNQVKQENRHPALRSFCFLSCLFFPFPKSLVSGVLATQQGDLRSTFPGPDGGAEYDRSSRNLPEQSAASRCQLIVSTSWGSGGRVPALPEWKQISSFCWGFVEGAHSRALNHNRTSQNKRKAAGWSRETVQSRRQSFQSEEETFFFCTLTVIGALRWGLQFTVRWNSSTIRHVHSWKSVQLFPYYALSTQRPVNSTGILSYSGTSEQLHRLWHSHCVFQRGGARESVSRCSVWQEFLLVRRFFRA